MPYRFGPFFSNELDRLAREQLERERLEQLMQLGNVLFGGTAPGAGSTSPWERTSSHMPGVWNGEPIIRPMPMPYHPQHPGSPVDPEYMLKPMPYRPGAWIDPKDALMPKGLFAQGRFEGADRDSSTDALGSMASYTQDSHANQVSTFPFRVENRKPDGTWDAQDATDENIKGTSVDPYEPKWPRWKQRPPLHGEGEFISHEPFFDIDEITQKAEFYPPGRPLTDKNVGGHPATRQRIGDMPGGNLWRRRLLVGGAQEAGPYTEPLGRTPPEPADMRGLQLAGLAPSQSRPRQGTQTARPQTTFDDNDVELLARLIFAEGANQFRKPGVYLGLGHTVLNRMKARGFPNTLQGVIFDRTPSGVPQFESVGGNLWNLAGNPGALTADNAIAYQAARATANDLLYGSEYNFDDPTGGATYFYSTTRNSPPAGFFTNRINSGRLQETYKAGDPRTGEFRFLRDTQP